MNKITISIVLIPALLTSLAFFSHEKEVESPHSKAEIAFFKKHQPYFSPESKLDRDPEHFIPIDSSVLFPTSNSCKGCHGYDPLMHALITTEGKDVNVYDDWRSTMMANSARDPFWRAKVSHETLVNPAHSIELEDKCTTCHAPAGNYQAKLHGHKAHYSIADLVQDSLGIDGVNCQMCHAQSPLAVLGTNHSGSLPFDTAMIRIAYGPYEFAFAPPMHNFVGITPKYGDQITDAGLCAGCHTLITETVDLNGEKTGETFVEQATYHEWLNSKYDEQHLNTSCQSCHLPRIPDEIIISTNYQFLTPKFPYALHEMAGANVTMLQLLKNNREQLGIDALPEHFDSTIAATQRMLREKTLTMSLTPGVLVGDTAYFDLKMLNKAGHKFPSGYPARRSWVEFVVQNEAGDTLFHSGRYADDYSLPDENVGFEPHYDVISKPDQVQIYELIAGDVTGAFTNVLERGKNGLKDNRLVPQGFLLSDPVYDTTKIIGHALMDADFNYGSDGVQGSGSDILHFHIPMQGYQGHLSVHAKVWYQSLPPKFVNPMFDHTSPEIDAFKMMFQTADKMPYLVGEVGLDSIFVTPVGIKNIDNQSFVKIGPNPTLDGKISVQTSKGVRIQNIKAYTMGGKLLSNVQGPDLYLPPTKGAYLVIVKTNKGSFSKKIVQN